MKLAVIGLGKMGLAIALRAHRARVPVIGFDLYAASNEHAKKEGITVAESIAALAGDTHVFMIMVPAGKPVDDVIEQLLPHLKAGDVVIDGGNSHYKDSMRRAVHLFAHGVYFLDCGTSGGIHGLTHGFCLMVGGEQVAYEAVLPILKTIAAHDGVALVGPSGVGHYVKMVHNGIEYGMLQAYAEGFHLIKEGTFKNEQIDLEQLSALWQHGAVIRSFILELTHNVFKQDQELTEISGQIGENGTGQWTVEDAHQNKIPVPVIEDALKVRGWSRESGGNYATKVIAMLRNQFGGHEFKKKEDK